MYSSCSMLPVSIVVFYIIFIDALMPFCTQICIDVSVIVCILGDASQLLLCWRIISYYFPEIYDAE